VLSNLLNNAVRHGARNQPITLSARGESDKITVQVRNYGRRIPADQLQVIFNPLVQIPALADDTGPPTGLGLGLYIAHEIVAMHGGTIVAESSEEDGTVFSARLPRAQAEARA
jgi:signal transduction histidine kinase